MLLLVTIAITLIVWGYLWTSPYVLPFNFGQDSEQKIEEFHAVKSNYVYNPQDLHPRLFELDNPFPSEVMDGVEFTIDSTSEDFYKTNNGYELKYIVGYDVKPGTYQVQLSGDVIPIAFDVMPMSYRISFQTEDPIYNITLHEGDIIYITYWDYKDKFSFEFKPQSDFINYESGMSGMFVYGQSNFYSIIDVPREQYTVTYCYGNDGDKNHYYNGCDFVYGQIISEAGSFIITESIDYAN